MNTIFFKYHWEFKEIIDLIEQYYPLWVISAVIVGIAFPEIKILSRYSPILLAIMIGAISLTVTAIDLVDQDLKAIFIIFLLHLTMPFLAFVLALMFNLPNVFVVGMVLIGTVTPEFATPVITQLSNGDTPLSSSVLLITGFSSIITVPVIVRILIQMSIKLNLTALVVDLVLILLIPMSVGIFLKSWKPKIISKYNQYYSPTATIMLIMLIGIATATNSTFIRSQGLAIFVLFLAVLLMNISGYGLGMFSGQFLDHNKKITAVYSIGMRDFAVAIALILSSELKPIIALPAVLYGIVEILSSSILVKYFNSEKFLRKSDNATNH